MSETQGLAELPKAITIDFIGLAAFVARDWSEFGIPEVEVLLVAAEKATDDKGASLGLCKHSPYLVFEDDVSVVNDIRAWSFVSDPAMPEKELPTDQFSVWTPPYSGKAAGKSVALMPLTGSEVRIEVRDPTPLNDGNLVLDHSICKVLDLKTIALPEVLDARVDKAWKTAKDDLADKIVSCRCHLEQGTLESIDESTEATVFYPVKGVYTRRNARTFSQVVRFNRFASPNITSTFIRIVNWKGKRVDLIELKPGKSVTIVNLCGFEKDPPRIATDMLAFYNLLPGGPPSVDKRRVAQPWDPGSVVVNPRQQYCPPIALNWEA